MKAYPHYNSAHGIIICVDTKNNNCTNEAKEWLLELEKFASDNIYRAIVALKSDSTKGCNEKLRNLAYTQGVPFFEVSTQKSAKQMLCSCVNSLVEKNYVEQPTEDPII